MKRSIGGISIAGSMLLVSGAVCAIELPQQKIGLWETRMQHSGGKHNERASQHCIDAEALAHGKQVADDYAKKNCSKNETRQEGGAWISDMVCTAGGSTMSTRSVTTFDGTDAYHTEMKVSYEPPVAGQTASTTTVDGKWLGACKAGS